MGRSPVSRRSFVFFDKQGGVIMYENNLSALYRYNSVMNAYMGRESAGSAYRTGVSEGKTDAERYGMSENGKDNFMDSVQKAASRRSNGIDIRQQSETAGKKEQEESLEEKLKKFDEEIERIKEENKRERKRIQEERIRKKLIRRKLMEKLAFKKYLARQDEIQQLNEKIALERAVGEDVYIEKPPLSKSLSVAEIMAICSQI